MQDLTILYRGPLASCNYGCAYCPFALRRETRAEHAADAAALQRFVAWVKERTEWRISVFFTPWGEALMRRRYQAALACLTNLPHVGQVAVQTNLSCRLAWVDACDKRKLGLWATYHPTQTTRERFLSQCFTLLERGARCSVGVVGLKEHAGEIAALRQALPEAVYLWINAYKRVPDYYGVEDIARFTEIDPLFPLNNQYHNSLGHACRTGAEVISVDGAGAMRRCHFVPEIIGNLYTPDWANALRPRPCPNATCGCHIGYVHLEHLRADAIFGDGLLARIPAQQQ